MSKTLEGRARKLGRINHACMNQFIGQNQITLADQCRNRRQIGQITTTKHTSRFGLLGFD